VRLLRSSLAAGLLAAAVAVTGLASCWLVKSNADLDAPPGPDAAAESGDAADEPQADAAKDAGTADVSPFGCTIGDILCEDFEQGISSYWQNNDLPLSSLTIIDSTKAAHGKSSMLAHIDPADGGEMYTPQAQIFVDQGSATPLTPNFYVRFFLYVKSGQLAVMRSDNDSLIVLLEPNGDAAELRLAGPPGAKVLGLANTYDGLSNISATPFPLDGWHCVEWGVAPTGMSVSVDGTPLDDLTVMSTVKPIQSEMVGFAPEVMTLASAVGQDVWFDEIVINSQPVGCVAFEHP
jgi:hypothetical protein